MRAQIYSTGIRQKYIEKDDIKTFPRFGKCLTCRSGTCNFVRMFLFEIVKKYIAYEGVVLDK